MSDLKINLALDPQTGRHVDILGNGRFLMALCQASYLPIDQFHSAAVILGMSITASADPSDPAFWALCRSDHAAVFVHRGSANESNWLHDFEFIQIDNPIGAGMVHQGFCDSLHPQWPMLDTLARSLAPVVAGGDPIVITGHSFGAARAILQAAWLNAEGAVSVDSVYTFGGPRVGNREFAGAYAPANTIRFVHKDDIVPRLPPILNYRHVGMLAYLDDSATCRLGGKMPIDLVPLTQVGQFVADHTTYVAALNAAQAMEAQS